MDEEIKESKEDIEEREKEPFDEKIDTIDTIDETEKLKQQVKEEQDKYLRSLADMENARKRMEKDTYESTRFAVEKVIKEFLIPLDHFESAFSFIHQASEETQNWAKGFEMILTQFKEILSRHNIQSFSSEGKMFDPHLHEVLELEETEKYKGGTILQEFVKGYKRGDRILRPARVKVAKEPSKDEKQ